jgi:O-antigen/teichoic acid export membrane protein
VLRSLSTWLIIILGGGLWALSGSTFILIIWTLLFLIFRYFNYFKALLLPVAGPKIDWWKEVWPMQWRIAVSWLSGYFCYSLFTPVIFHFHGPALAGQMGMTWSMTMALSIISSMWITTRAPEFGVLISKREYKSLDRLLYHAAAVSVLIASLGALVIFSLVSLLYYGHFPLASRFLGPLPTAFLLMATVLMQLSIAQSTYLRAHKKEPFMLMSLISAIVTTILVFLLGRSIGPLGIAFSYFAIVAFFGIPYGTVIWYRCRNSWHSDYFAEPETLQSGVM